MTTSKSYFPKDNNEYFDDCDLSLVEWLRQYAGEDAYEQDLRGWLGRVLFSGEEALKKSQCFIWWRKSEMYVSKK